MGMQNRRVTPLELFNNRRGEPLTDLIVGEGFSVYRGSHTWLLFNMKCSGTKRLVLFVAWSS